VQNSSGADGGSMEFTAGSSLSDDVGGAASFITGSSSSGAGGSLTLESGDFSTTGGAMNGGRGENSLGGSVTIESGVGTEATDSDSGAASFRPPMQVFLESVVACHYEHRHCNG
jgi:hypothetical protein